MDCHVQLLDEITWPAFVQLVERHNGVWGGCWCMGYHPEVSKTDGAHNRSVKEQRVREGRAHAALVYAGDLCVGWCQFGSPDELSGIKYRRDYDATARTVPDWRITCFFVDRKYRGRGVADLALSGAMREIARLGGGTVEAYPEDFNGREVSKSLPYMFNGLDSMFERRGFGRVGRLGKNHWLMTAVVSEDRT